MNGEGTVVEGEGEGYAGTFHHDGEFANDEGFAGTVDHDGDLANDDFVADENDDGVMMNDSEALDDSGSDLEILMRVKRLRRFDDRYAFVDQIKGCMTFRSTCQPVWSLNIYIL